MALWRRNDIINRAEAGSELAVLDPAEPGAFPAPTRAALAARMARECGSDALAGEYGSLASQGTADDENIAHGSPLDWIVDTGLRAAARHCDLLTLNPTGATRSDIEALREAGFSDADIVALSELIAFVNYHVRCIEGLRLIAEAGK
ncbi:MAG: hypothetical protein ABTQ30_04755 [Rhizobiaceae bacterium]